LRAKLEARQPYLKIKDFNHFDDIFGKIKSFGFVVYYYFLKISNNFK
jgi:hypothetical protein